MTASVNAASKRPEPLAAEDPGPRQPRTGLAEDDGPCTHEGRATGQKAVALLALRARIPGPLVRGDLRQAGFTAIANSLANS